MRELDLTSLRLFVTVCETRSLAKAGQAHHVVGSAVSKRMQQLEAGLGIVLLARHRRGVVPTAAGEVLLGHARSMLASADQALLDLSAQGHGIKGPVRVMATLSAILERLPDDIASFLAVPDHQQIQVTIEERNGYDIVQALRGGQTAVGVCWDVEELDGLVVRPYLRDRLVAVMHPAHRLARRSRCAFEDTLNTDHIGMPPETSMRLMLDRMAGKLGRHIAYRMSVTTIDAVLRGTRAGLGLAILPDALIAGRTDGLRVVPLDLSLIHI